MSAVRWGLMALVIIGWSALAYGLRCYFRRLDKYLVERLAATRPHYEGNPDACMCGALISEHGMWENHGPVSETDYLARERGES